MQFVQFVAARADTGAVLPRAWATVYLSGTSTLATLRNADGSSLSNPFQADAVGAIGFAAPNGAYDCTITSADGAYSLPLIESLQLYDLSGLDAQVSAAILASSQAVPAASQAIAAAAFQNALSTSVTAGGALPYEVSALAGGGGTGGTPGTYAGAVSGFPGFTWHIFVGSDGKAIPVIDTRGISANGSAPTLVMPTVPGLTGATTPTATVSVIANGRYFSAPSSDATQSLAWQNLGGVLTAVMFGGQQFSTYLASAVSSLLSGATAQAYQATDKLGTAAYLATTIGNPMTGGAQPANAGSIRVNTGQAVSVDGPLTSIAIKASVGGTATILLGPVTGGTAFTPAIAFPVTLAAGANTLLPGIALPYGARVKAGWFQGLWSSAGGAQIAFDAGGSSLGLTSSGVAVGTTYSMTAGSALLTMQLTYGVMQGIIEPRLEGVESSVANLNSALAQTQTIGAPASATLVAGAGAASGVTYVLADQIATSGAIGKLRVFNTLATAGSITFGLFSKSGANFTLVGSTTTILVPGGIGAQTVALAIAGAAGLYPGFSPSSGVMSFLSGAAYGSGYYSSSTAGFQSTFTDRNNGSPNAGVQLQIGFDIQYIPAMNGPAASVRDLVTSLTATFAGLTVSAAGALTRDNSPLNFTGSATLDAVSVQSASNVTTNFAGGTLALGFGGSSSTAFALMNASGYLPKAHLTNLVVKDASTSAVLALGTDYLANTEHGAIGLPAIGSARNVSASFNYTQVRYDLVYLDPEALTIGVLKGTPRDRDVIEYRPVPNAGNQLPLCYARVVGGAITSIIDVHDVEGGIRRKYAADLAERRRLNQKALRKIIGYLRAGTPFNQVGYGDSETAVQRDVPPYATANGAERDRITAGPFQSYPGYPDTNAGITLYTAVQLGMPDDGAGQVHTKIGWNWELIAGFKERYPNAQISYQNMGIASTTTETTDQGNGVLNGGHPLRLAAATALAVNGLAVICFGQNGMGRTQTRDEMIAIIQAFQSAGAAGIIVMGVTRPNALSGRTVAQWEFTNRAVERAADYCGVAFVPTFYVANDDNIGVICADPLDLSAGNFTNHPFVREYSVYGELIRQAVME